MLGPNFFPSRRQMSKYELSIKIDLEPFMGGYKVDFKDAISKTVQRILELKKYSGNSENLTVKLSAGFDGSGSHVQRAGRNANINTKVGLDFKRCVCIGDIGKEHALKIYDQFTLNNGSNITPVK